MTSLVNFFSFFMYLFLAVLGLQCCMGFSPAVASYSLVVASYSLVVVHGLRIVLASLVAEHRLQGMQASVVAARGLSSYSSWGLEHRLNSYGAWGLVSPQHMGSSQIRDQTVSPAWANGFFTTETPEKSFTGKSSAFREEIVTILQKLFQKI